MKRSAGKVLAVLLALVLTVGLLPSAALAAGTLATSVSVSGQTMDGTKKYFVNGKATATAPSAALGEDGYTAVFDGNGTLTIKNFDGGNIGVRGNNDLTIKVEGTNRTGSITSWEGDLTITGGTDAVLRVSAESDALNTYRGSMSVSGLKELSVTGTGPNNPVIDVYFGAKMEFSNIETMRVRGKTDYGMIMARATEGVTFTNIGILEALCENSDALHVSTTTKFIDCGTILLHSDKDAGLYVYNADVTIGANRLISTGTTSGISTWVGESKTVDLNVDALVLGGSKAVNDRGPQVKLPEGFKGDKNSQSVTYLPEGKTVTEATLSIDSSSTTQTYTGKPVEISVSGLSGANPTYIYTWTDAAGNTLTDTPVNAGTYRVTAYGFSDSEYSDFSNPTTAEVTIIRADYHTTPIATQLSKGNNLISLPALPDGLSYGDASCTSANADKLTLTRAGDTLAIVVGTTAAAGETFTVKVQIPESANHNASEQVLNLTMRDSAAFDLGTGTVKEVEEDGGTIAAPSTADAWTGDGYAKEYGYTFEGWYTAPNGWGEKVESGFESSHIYYAHWEATRAIYGYEVLEDQSLKPLYVAFDYPKTVYTTGLDFGYDQLPQAKDDSYALNGDILTLTAIHIRATDGCAIILPANTTLKLVNDPALTINDSTKFYDENGIEVTITDDTDIFHTFSGNVILGPETSTEPAFYADGDLTVESTGVPGIDVRQGGLWVAGSLTVKGGYVFSTDIQVDGELTLEDSTKIAADLYTGNFSVIEAVEMGSGSILSADDFFAGGLVAGSESMLIITGDVWLDGDAALTGAMLDADGYLMADDITISGDANVELGGMLFADGQLEIADSSVAVRYGGGFVGVAAHALTVRNSTLAVEGSAGTAILLAAPVQEGGQASFTLDRAAITTSGVTMQRDDSGNLISRTASGDTAPSLTIEPQAAAPTYAVTVAETEHGTVTPSQRYAEAGARVTLTVTPDAGYELDSLTVTNRSGAELTLTDRGEGRYSFTMPAGRATVTATFRTETARPAYSDFVDLDANAWYHDGVAWALEKGLMQGIDATHFAPNGAVSRSMAATVLWRLAGEPVVNYAMSFSDVDEGSWYGEAVRWAASEGVIQGYEDGSFRPDDSISREQFAAMAYRYVQSRGEGFTGSWYFLLDFSDAADISAWADEGMHWCVMKQVLLGMGDGTLSPASGLTRAQLAVMLMRLDAALGE